MEPSISWRRTPTTRATIAGMSRGSLGELRVARADSPPCRSFCRAWTLIFFRSDRGGVVCLRGRCRCDTRPRGAFNRCGIVEELWLRSCGLWSVDPVHRYDVGCCLPAPASAQESKRQTVWTADAIQMVDEGPRPTLPSIGDAIVQMDDPLEKAPSHGAGEGEPLVVGRVVCRLRSAMARSTDGTRPPIPL